MLGAILNYRAVLMPALCHRQKVQAFGFSCSIKHFLPLRRPPPPRGPTTIHSPRGLSPRNCFCFDHTPDFWGRDDSSALGVGDCRSIDPQRPGPHTTSAAVLPSPPTFFFLPRVALARHREKISVASRSIESIQGGTEPARSVSKRHLIPFPPQPFPSSNSAAERITLRTLWAFTLPSWLDDVGRVVRIGR